MLKALKKMFGKAEGEQPQPAATAVAPALGKAGDAEKTVRKEASAAALPSPTSSSS